MRKIILGVDGGGTKSHLAFFDDTGSCLGCTTYGPLNHEGMRGSYDELEEILINLLPKEIKKIGAGIDDIAFAVFGLAGVDTDSQQKLISKMIDKIGFKNQITCNDALLGVPAGCPDCVGICAINGTGLKLAAIDHSGNIMETCGLGSLTDDLGGGPWYGFKAVSSVYNEMFKLGKPTIMKDMIFDLTGITCREEYLEIFTEKYYTGQIDKIKLNSIAFNAAALGDAVAIGVLEESATQYAGGIARLIMDMDFPADKTVHVALAGSVFMKQKVRVLHDIIEKMVDEALGGRSVNYVVLDAPPVAGAVMWASQKAGFDIKIDTVKAGLSATGV